ncbi:MAG: sulfurtransferase TusA family protein [Hyphomicrobiales bacterium]
MVESLDIKADFVINAEGLLCPMPVLKLAKKASQVETGVVIELRATDPMAPIDSEHFCGQKGYDFLGKKAEKIDGITVFLMKIRVKK